MDNRNKGMLLEELDKLMKEASIEDILGSEREEETSEGDLNNIMKHYKNVLAAIDFIDGLSDVKGENELAFDAEIALRKAAEKLKELTDKVYDEVGEEEPKSEETQEETEKMEDEEQEN